METVNQENTAGEQQVTERTFTQSEMNAVVQDRLAREQSKYADYDQLKEKAALYDQMEEASKTDLQKEKERADDYQTKYEALKKSMDVQEIRRKVAEETGVPVGLLSAETEEACHDQAVAILSFAKPDKYPNVKDAGEVNNVGGKKKTRDQFADWLGKQLG